MSNPEINTLLPVKIEVNTQITSTIHNKKTMDVTCHGSTAMYISFGTTPLRMDIEKFVDGYNNYGRLAPIKYPGGFWVLQERTIQ